MMQAAKLACYDRTGVAPVDVVICAVGSIPKTTSGKVRRIALRESLTQSGTETAADLVDA
jgi:acyl-coenzyme A synthetase/AMP-(fatty) acid ligase